MVEFDFGVERTGYLQLAYREGPRQRLEVRSGAVLLAFGNEPIGEAPWSADSLFHPIPGAGLYQDSTLRRFRYVAVAGLPGLFSAEVLATSEASFTALAARSITWCRASRGMRSSIARSALSNCARAMV